MNNLVALFEEALEFQNFNGTVLSNGKVRVFFIGRTSLADIYNDVAGEYPSENPKILDNLGMGPIYVNPAFDYEIVVYDEYDNELFSVKKYLHSNGAHSTSNVEVVPSENIQVSAWTQGDVQVYMPYITGNLGKVYSGVEPIVVNNEEDKISANHVALGLQEPLYFVEDSESACIIGCSAQSEIPSALSGKWEDASNMVIENSAQWEIPEGTMNESAFSYDASSNITAYNGSAFKAGDEFPESATEAINVVTANSAKWNGPYVPLGQGNTADSWSMAQGDRNKAIGTSLAQGQRNTAEYFSFTQGEFNSANSHSMSQGVNNSAKQSSLAQGGYNTAEYYSFTQGEGNSAHDHSMSQGGNNSAKNSSLAQGTNNSALNFSIAQGTNNTASNGSQAFGQCTIATATGMAIGQYNLKEDAAFVIGNGTAGARSDLFVIDHSGNVSSQGDISASGVSLTSFYTDYQTNSANFITALPDDLVYTGDLNDYAKKDFVNDSIDSATSALLPTSSFSSVSASFLTALPSDLVYTADITGLATTAQLSEKLDSTAFSTVSGDFLTAVDLTPYQTTAGMTAYQPAGDYLTTADSAQFITALPADLVYTADIQDMATTGDLADKLDTSSFSSVSGDYLVGSNVSGFVITATGDGFSNGMTVAISQDTSFAGMYFSESDVNGSKQIYIDPEKIMFYSAGTPDPSAESIDAGDIATLKSLSSSKQDNLTFSYTTANEISAINSSAIAGGTGGSFPSSANEACEVVTANSAEWNKVTGLSGYVRNDTRWLDIGADNYVETYNTASEKYVYDSFAFGYKNSAASTAVSMGNANSAGSQSFAQGNGNSAYRFSFAQGTQNFASGLVAGANAHGSFAQGFKNSAYSGSFAQGSYNVASGYSFAQGGTGSYSNSAIDHSFAQGARCDASACSFAQGKQCHASAYSIAQGSGANASDYSQAFGRGTIASSSGMAIGTFNETDTAAFVIGNGTAATARSDAFIVYHDGSVSAAGKISANGVELGAGAEIVNHDNTLSGNGTVDSPLGVVPGYNETVLWEGNLSSKDVEISLTDSLKNYNSYKVFGYNTENKYGIVNEYTYHSAGPNWFSITDTRIQDNSYLTIYGDYVSANTDWDKLKITYMSNKYCISGGLSHSTSYGVGITKIVGINRKQ